MAAKKQLDYIDIAKGLGMLFVIWGHIKHGGLTPAFIYSFHMPLFFFISGMLFNPLKYDKFLPFVKSRVKRLLVPYVIYSFVTWLVWAGYSSVSHKEVASYIEPLLQTFIAQGSAGHMLHNVPLWFITCLFMVEMIYFFICRIGKVSSPIICFVLALASMYCIEFNLIPYYTELPWNFEVALVGIFFYAIGNTITRNISLQKIYDKGIKSIGICAIVSITTGMLVTHMSRIYGGADMGSDYFTLNPLAFLVMAIGGSVMTITLSLTLSAIPWNKMVNNRLKWIGKNSMDILSIHVPIKGIIIIVLAKLFHVQLKDAYFYGWSHAIVALIATIITVTVAVMIINWCSNKQKNN